MIDARLRLFIPSRAVSIPIGPAPVGFGGDNRGFSFDQGTSRVEIWVDVDNSPTTTNPISVKRLAFGESTMYHADKLQDVVGKPFWWKTIRRDPFLQLEASPDAVATAPVSESTLSAQGSLETGPFALIPNVRVKFHVSATVPLEALAPPINCDLDVLISATGTPFLSYSVTGSHDGFPAYELYISQRLVYSFDPESAGTNPLHLALVGNIPVNIPFTALL
jgi:Protein of unknown function (DUF3238)